VIAITSRAQRWRYALPRCSGGFSSEHFWIDGQRLRAATKAPQRGEGRAVPERCSSLLNLLSTPGVVYERELSIKEVKKCGEPAGGP